MGRIIQGLGPLPPFDTRGGAEKANLLDTFSRPFSGYLGGIHTGGYWVERLEAEWCEAFGCKYAIPCNSATSGLLAACMAAGIGSRDIVWAPVYTMSATAACAKMLGARIEFIDIDPGYFSMNIETYPDTFPKVIVITNLFGHPASLVWWRGWCERHEVQMIEDNAQGGMAVENNRFAGTIGHIGVFSLNVHKHLQVGEGGIVVTDDSDLALRVRDAINHGELRPGLGMMGLNLRMTEPTAAMACAQLNKALWIIEGRRELALEMTDMVKNIPFVTAPKERDGCRHVYYQWAAKVAGGKRKEFVSKLAEYGLPMNIGYSPLLSDVFHTGGDYPVARRMEDEELITFEICSYDPTKQQREIMREIFKYAGDLE